MSSQREVIMHDVLHERVAQDKQWGGQDHDDEHLEDDWCHYIAKQNARALTVAMSSKQESLDEYRSRMVKIAALAIAALESFDRRHT